ncbi:FGGY family carbohydrate kinase [Aureimonas frigidaquae]|uniref:Uncharacterized protein n=1 Tax=Aureimonas frigidaquae TaxID=424757 RepID=A0A0N7KXU6_9HYPH|nr:FGGY family carbohydrate kinase [Aureimonas frigidaquae]BAT27905.1 hypothetical protein [Aureimonas frigidaquae]
MNETNEPAQACVAVIDAGKTNLKLAVAAADGTILDQISTGNGVTQREGAPWRRHDLAAAEAWLLDALGQAARRFRLEAIVAAGHGSGGVLVREDELERPEPILPMIDYEQPAPQAVDAVYRAQSGDFAERGSAIMMGATHQARQMLWVMTERPDAAGEASAFLSVPQYWAWRFSGGMASEITNHAAQSGFWRLQEGRPSDIVRARGWGRYLPPLQPAHATLGPVRPAIAARTGLSPTCRVLAGIHDSSANFYRYQAAGLQHMTVVSTGTWIVALSDHAALDRLDPRRGMTLNADVDGRPLGGALTQGGREFAAIAGEGAAGGMASQAALQALVARESFAVPSFGRDDGLFPGSAGRGRIEGPAPADAGERVSLALMTAALLASECVAALGNQGTIVLDGAFLRDPLFAPLLAALNPQCRVAFNRQADGVAAGAALLASHGRPARSVPLALEDARPLEIAKILPYAARWRSLALAAAA